jgi:hypothetical protein
MSDSQYCFSHNPATRQQHQAATRRGGSISPYTKDITVLPASNLSTANDIVLMLSDTINRVRVVNKDGSMAITTANAVGHLSGKLLEALKVADLEARLDKLEASIK